MDNETFKACQLAIRARIKHLNWFHSSNSPQAERAGLLLFGCALGVLARRFIKKPDWPGHDVTDDVRLNWELQWYFDYVKAIMEVSRAAQIAVREKRLILRSQLTRTALDTKSLGAWINADFEAAQADAAKGFFPGVLELGILDAWPDVLCLPPGAAYAQDIAVWAAADGIATADDALALLMGTANTETPAPVLVASLALPKQRTQERRILELLTAQGYDPLKLSKRAAGKPGPKAEIRTLALSQPALFTASSFDKAWERLRNDGAVTGAE